MATVWQPTVVPSNVVQNDHLSKTLGERFRTRRQKLDLSMNEVAERIQAQGYSITHQAIAKWERGQSMPRGINQYALARALETSHAELFALDTEPQAS